MKNYLVYFQNIVLVMTDQLTWCLVLYRVPGWLTWGWCRTGHTAAQGRGRMLHSTGLSWRQPGHRTAESQPVGSPLRGALSRCMRRTTAAPSRPSSTPGPALVSYNMRGQLQIRDLRSNSQTPDITSCQGAGLTCLA